MSNQVLGVPQGNVVILTTRRPYGFRYLPGQYIFVALPSISRFEFHPFTLTSAPHEEYLTLHVRAVGDWTRKLLVFLSPLSNVHSILVSRGSL